MKTTLPFALLLLAASAPAQTAEQPSAGTTYTPLSGIQRQAPTGSSGVLATDFGVTQILNWDGSAGNNYEPFNAQSAVSGNVTFNWMTQRTDLRFRYAGGAVFYNNSLYKQSINGAPQTRNTSFHGLDIDDSIKWKKFVLVGGDSFHYTPNQYSLGDGIPGVGGIGQVGTFVYSNPGLSPNYGLVTQGVTSYSNAAFGEVDYRLNARNTITSNATYGFSRLPDASLYDANQISLQEGYDYRISARTSVALSYQYLHSTFVHNPLVTNVHYGNVKVQHRFSRSFKVEGSVGPQFFDSTGDLELKHSVGADVKATYTRQRNSYDAHYTRHSSTGGLSLYGLEMNQYGGGFTRELSRQTLLSTYVDFDHGRTLFGSGTINNQQIGVQMNHRLRQNTTAFANFVFRHQHSEAVDQSAVLFDGNSVSVGLGLNFSPHGIRLKR